MRYDRIFKFKPCYNCLNTALSNISFLEANNLEVFGFRYEYDTLEELDELISGMKEANLINRNNGYDEPGISIASTSSTYIYTKFRIDTENQNVIFTLEKRKI